MDELKLSTNIYVNQVELLIFSGMLFWEDNKAIEALDSLKWAMKSMVIIPKVRIKKYQNMFTH